MKVPEYPETIELDQYEIDGLVSKAKIAVAEDEEVSRVRRICLDAFARQPLGDEEEGRCQFQAGDVHMQVEGSFPYLMGRALANDPQIRVKGPDPRIAKALLVKVRESLEQQSTPKFWTYVCVIKDALLSRFGAVKLYWSRVYAKSVETRVVDEQKLALLEAAKAAGGIQGLEVRELPQSQEIVPADDGVTGAVVVVGPRQFEATVTLTEIENSGPVVTPVPPHEFLIERGKSHMNDRRGVGHRTTITVGELLAWNERQSLPGRPFFNPAALQKAIDLATREESPAQQQEREARERICYIPTVDGRIDFTLTDNKLRKPITATEWSDQVVYKGKLVPAVIWMASDQVLRCEPSKDGIVPFCGFSPFLIPHMLRGLGVAEQHVHTQDVRSSLGRSLVDYVSRLVDEETYIINEGTDILGLKQRRPGQLVYAKPEVDFARSGTQSNLDAKLIMAADWMQTSEQDVGPANRWTLGQSVDPRNSTATGQEIMSRAAGTRQNMLGLTFNIMFQVDLYNKLIRLHQVHTDPFTVTVDGAEITLRREDIQGDYVAYSEAGRQFDVNDAELARTMLVWQRTGEMAKLGLATPQNLYNAAKRVLLACGETVVSDFITPPAAAPPAIPAAPPAIPGAPAPPPGGMAAPMPQPDRLEGANPLEREMQL